MKKLAPFFLFLLVFPSPFNDYFVSSESIPKQMNSAELQAFLNSSTVSDTEYNQSFTCVDFSNGVVSELWEEGVFSCIAVIYFYDGNSHMVVAVNTTDRGVMFVEAEEDLVWSKHDVLVTYNVERVSSCFGRFEPEDYTCYYVGETKRCY